MNTDRKTLIDDLRKRTETVIAQAKALNNLPDQALKNRPGSESWNALECLEHLNLYGDFYLKEIEQRMLRASKSPEAKSFKSGWLGNKFALSLLPAKEGEKLNKMNTFKSKNTSGAEVNHKTIQRFLKQQQRMLELLNEAAQLNLSKVKTAITLSPLIKIRLGDTFRVVIYHNQRHLVQAQKAAGLI
jgi:hypothetical protein